MKTRMITFLFVILLLSGLQGMAQTTAKDSRQPKKKSGEISGKLPSGQTDFKTTRAEDLKEFDHYQKMFREAVRGGVTEEAETLRNKLANIARREIARSRKNFQDMEAGITKDLETWHKEHAPDKPLDIELEKQNLKSTINYEQTAFDKFISANLNNMSNRRDKTSVTGYLESFKTEMEHNLKYGDAGPKTPPPPPPPPPPSSGKGNALGSGYVTKKGGSGQTETGDLQLQRWNDSQVSLTNDFIKGQSGFQKYLDSGNSKMARTNYHSLIQLMMTAINSNNWLLGQMRSGNISKSGFDVTALQNKVKKQQGILEEAQKIKVSTPEELEANSSKAVEVLLKFAGTLKQK